MAILIIEHSDLSGSDRFGETLRNLGHRLNTVSVHRDETLPPNLNGVDGIVSCGGPQAPDDHGHAWMDRELELIRDAHAAELPVVGICLGNQLVARALGASTAPMKAGIEFGFHEVRLTPDGREDPVFAGIAWNSMQFEYHSQEVTDLPPGARLLATNDHCHVQAWRCGVRTYGVQYHPEIPRDRINEWIDDEPEVVERSGLTRETITRQTEEHWATFERLGDRLFENLALYVMPLDRRYAGVTKDLHH